MTSHVSRRRGAPDERRAAILDAAGRCFVIHGFHRTTMQDLAQMAGMSVGNLYRYFPAKDAVVLALAERDRAEAARFLCDDDAEQWPTLVRLIRHHLIEAPRDKSVLLVEVWAEGSRNPTVAAVLARYEAENQAWIAGVLEAEGSLPPDEAAALAERIRIEAQGIQVARALSASYDPAGAVDRLIGSVEARLGKITRRAASSAVALGAAA